MTGQDSLFGPRPGGAGAEHPLTTHKAALDKGSQVRWGTQRHTLLTAYDAAAREGLTGLTDEQAGERTKLLHRRAAYWMRCSELRKMGLIKDTGKTWGSSLGAEVMVCKITDKGRRALMRAFAERAENGDS